MKNDPTRSPVYHPTRPPRSSLSPRRSLALGTPDWQPSLGAWPEGDGVHFRVWAPERQQVEVLLARPGHAPISHPLEKQADGSFTGIPPQAHVGELYRYRVDGNNLYPDPASRFQPDGVHGPSQIIDPAAFVWTDADWRGIPADDLIIYELHIGTFSAQGTFEGVIQHLPHLVKLGVTAIELMPLGDFPGLRNWGYDGVAPFAPARCYGVPDDLRRLVDAAHAAGLAVLVDVVYNHLGPDGNYTGVFSPYYVTSWHRTAWGEAINLDGNQSAGVREFFIQNALHWIHEYHLDGLRLDATHAMVDTRSRHFIAELNAQVQASAGERQVHVIAEDNRNFAPLVKPVSQGGMGLTAVWSDDFHHQVRRLLAGDKDGYYVDFTDRLEDLVKTVTQGWFYSGQYAPFFKRPHGTDPQGIPLGRFVFFIQNHDQVGNRALGDRLHHTLDAAAYRAASALLLSLPEIPLLFMGQEWAASSPFLYFTDHDEELGAAVTEGRREEFKSFSTFVGSQEIPDPQSPDTFRQSKLHWPEKMNEPHASMGLYYQALIGWRRHAQRQGLAPDLAATALDDSTLLLKRWSRNGKLFLILIALKQGCRVDLSGHRFFKEQGRIWDVELTSEEKAFCPDPTPPSIHLLGDAPVIELARPGAVILHERL